MQAVRLIGGVVLGALVISCGDGTAHPAQSGGNKTSNTPPVFGTISVAMSAVAGENVGLTAAATDADGDPLSFTWTQTAPVEQGSFTDANHANASWRSPEISSNTDFTLQVSVTDGEATITETRTITVTSPTLSDDIQPIFDRGCTACHGTTGSGGLDLTAAKAHEALVDKSIWGSDTCGATVRVAPGSPDRSLLVKRIEGSCGNREPQGNLHFFDDNPGLLTKIRSWILAGAINN